MRTQLILVFGLLLIGESIGYGQLTPPPSDITGNPAVVERKVTQVTADKVRCPHCEKEKWYNKGTSFRGHCGTVHRISTSFPLHPITCLSPECQGTPPFETFGLFSEHQRKVHPDKGDSLFKEHYDQCAECQSKIYFEWFVKNPSPPAPSVEQAPAQTSKKEEKKKQLQEKSDEEKLTKVCPLCHEKIEVELKGEFIDDLAIRRMLAHLRSHYKRSHEGLGGENVPSHEFKCSGCHGRIFNTLRGFIFHLSSHPHDKQEIFAQHVHHCVVCASHSLNPDLFPLSYSGAPPLTRGFSEEVKKRVAEAAARKKLDEENDVQIIEPEEFHGLTRQRLRSDSLSERLLGSGFPDGSPHLEGIPLGLGGSTPSLMEEEVQVLDTEFQRPHPRFLANHQLENILKFGLQNRNPNSVPKSDLTQFEPTSLDPSIFNDPAFLAEPELPTRLEQGLQAMRASVSDAETVVVRILKNAADEACKSNASLVAKKVKVTESDELLLQLDKIFGSLNQTRGDEQTPLAIHLGKIGINYAEIRKSLMNEKALFRSHLLSLMRYFDSEFMASKILGLEEKLAAPFESPFSHFYVDETFRTYLFFLDIPLARFRTFAKIESKRWDRLVPGRKDRMATRPPLNGDEREKMKEFIQECSKLYSCSATEFFCPDLPAKKFKPEGLGQVPPCTKPPIEVIPERMLSILSQLLQPQEQQEITTHKPSFEDDL